MSDIQCTPAHIRATMNSMMIAAAAQRTGVTKRCGTSSGASTNHSPMKTVADMTWPLGNELSRTTSRIAKSPLGRGRSTRSFGICSSGRAEAMRITIASAS